MSKEEKKSTENDLPESVNDQITDAVQQSNLMPVGEHPAFPHGHIYLNAAYSTGIMFQNAVNNQNNLNIMGQAATTQGIMQMYNIDNASDSISITKILNLQSARIAPESLHDEHHHDKK
ncbi:Killing trait domain-containing protein [Chryseobacterium soldanellicola]|uniref:Killing trait domain-containing protein n=1 Tax=Chryseobacterium soldanellicola TaxID=311333 RepID=A0A1H0YDG6_9FLAO|nr:RebB family R body protein [Chryseobacterium soldanellicola]SDQ13264.1 Killing trait domain-containing protein [Chryseobacterium soldanellicola]